MLAGEESAGAGDVEGAAGGDIEAVPLQFGILEEGDLGVATGGGAVEVGRGGIGTLRPCEGAESKEGEQLLHASMIAECVLECQEKFKRVVCHEEGCGDSLENCIGIDRLGLAVVWVLVVGPGFPGGGFCEDEDGE